ncbi:hypothetical protein ACOQFB_05685, partial [Anaeromyxobacter sp. Red801]
MAFLRVVRRGERTACETDLPAPVRAADAPGRRADVGRLHPQEPMRGCERARRHRRCIRDAHVHDRERSERGRRRERPVIAAAERGRAEAREAAGRREARDAGRRFDEALQRARRAGESARDGAADAARAGRWRGEAARGEGEGAAGDGPRAGGPGRGAPRA